MSVCLLPALQVSVLVMCHTRELAFQISKEYERFSKYMPSVKVSLLSLGWVCCMVLCRLALPALAQPVFTIYQAWLQRLPLRFAVVYAP